MTTKAAGTTPKRTSGTFTAVLTALLGEDWSTPQIEDFRITPDRCLLARVECDASFREFLGAEAVLIRYIQGIAETGPGLMATRWANFSGVQPNSRGFDDAR